MDITFMACRQAWLDTLEAFGIKRNIMVLEEREISDAIKRYGAEAVELALYGARFEPQTERFNPRVYISITRILRPRAGEERIDRFVNFGAMERTREAKRRERDAQMKRTRLESELYTDNAQIIPPEEARAKIREMLGHKKT